MVYNDIPDLSHTKKFGCLLLLQLVVFKEQSLVLESENVFFSVTKMG